MAKKSASKAAVLPAAQAVTYAPTIGNAEIVNMLIEQRVQLLEREIANLKEEMEAIVKTRDALLTRWVDAENEKLKATYFSPLMQVVSGLENLFKTQRSYTVRVTVAMDSNDEYYLFRKLDLHHGEDAQPISRKEKQNQHKYTVYVHLQYADTQQDVEDDDNYGNDEDHPDHVIQTTLDQIPLTGTFDHDDQLLVEWHGFHAGIVKLRDQINLRKEEIANRERMEKQALALFTATSIKSSPELSETMQVLAAGINNGQLLLGE